MKIFNMIASKSQNEELVLYFDFLNTLEKLAEQYTTSPSEHLMERIKICNEVSDFLKERLEKHNYQLDDERRKRVEESMKNIKNYAKN